MRLAGPGLGGSTSSLAGFPSLRTRQGRIQGLEAKPHRLPAVRTLRISTRSYGSSFRIGLCGAFGTGGFREFPSDRR